MVVSPFRIMAPAPLLVSDAAVVVSGDPSVNWLLVTKKMYSLFVAVVMPAKPVKAVLFASVPVERKAPEVSARVSAAGPVTVTAAAVESMTSELMVRGDAPEAVKVAPGVTVKRTLLEVDAANALKPAASKIYSASAPVAVDSGRRRLLVLSRTNEFPTSVRAGAPEVA